MERKARTKESGERPADHPGGKTEGGERSGLRWFIGNCLQDSLKNAAFFCLFCGIFAGVFYLYELPLGAVWYPALLCGLLWLLLTAARIRKAWKIHCRLQQLYGLPADMWEHFPETACWEDEDYQQLLRKLQEEQRQLKDEMGRKFTDLVDYYTIWVHQIKTPIASMRLNLQNEDSPLSRLLSEDLLRIEQYVEMVLAYLRLDGDSTDYVFREQDVETMVRQAVRKFASWFIRRRISLELEPISLKVVTDEKWLVFVLEQVLSNALKYTDSGKISIYVEEPALLCIRDTGIGISSQDLPRIFEKGYTGYNGRSDKKASGIGLYLCRRICENLGHTITAASVPDQGTVIRIDLGQRIEKPE